MDNYLKMSQGPAERAISGLSLAGQKLPLAHLSLSQAARKRAGVIRRINDIA
jgi:hypothetical protein